MIYTVSFTRLSLLFTKKDNNGTRVYDQRVIDPADLLKIRAAVLHGIGRKHQAEVLERGRYTSVIANLCSVFKARVMRAFAFSDRDKPLDLA